MSEALMQSAENEAIVQSPFGWLNNMSDADLNAMLNCTDQVNQYRARMGLPAWEETPAGQAWLERRTNADK